MSNIGYYRYKISSLKEGLNTVTFYKNGAAIKTVSVRTINFCEGFKLLKYLDSSGRYRVYPFNNRWQMVDKPTSLGNVNKLIKSISYSQSSSSNIGYKNVRTISMIADNVPVEELPILSDLLVSPKVYLYIGNGLTDEVSDWIEVMVKGDANTPRNRNIKKITVDVDLPEYYTIRL